MIPHQTTFVPKPVPEPEFQFFKAEITNLLSLGATVRCTECPDQYLSSIFLAPKPNGKKRFILNLKKLNLSVDPPHFKMEDYRTVLRLLHKGAFMTSIDLKDAYFLVSVTPGHRKYLRFTFGGQLYEFTCLPFGLSSAPFCFTKLMKPVVSSLRLHGISCVNYLDDFLILGSSFESCEENTKTAVTLLTSLGFLINFEKSCLLPSTTRKFLGFKFDSLRMRIELPLSKKDTIKTQALYLRTHSTCKIRDVARFIGILVSACPTIKYGWLYTKAIEREKFLALSATHMCFESRMSLPTSLHYDLDWWIRTIDGSFNDIDKESFKLEIFTDASLTGWGACCNSERTYGSWSEADKAHHINYLELQALFYGLKCFASEYSNCNLLLRCDNTTAVSYINKMGSIQFPSLCSLAREVWHWCETRNLWIFASYINSQANYEADSESRRSSSETEWSLSDEAFRRIKKTFGEPEVDLFASKINAKCSTYVSWHRDPDSLAVDAFTLDWKPYYFYAFPPFSLVLRTLQKIIHDRAEGVLVVPHWPSQPWYPTFSRLIIAEPLIMKPSLPLLSSPSRRMHPLAQTLTLVAARLSSARF